MAMTFRQLLTELCDFTSEELDQTATVQTEGDEFFGIVKVVELAIVGRSPWAYAMEEEIMQWYLRYEDGTLSGPGTKEEMSAMRDQVDDAIMFPESIFEPVPTLTGGVLVKLSKDQLWALMAAAIQAGFRADGFNVSDRDDCDNAIEAAEELLSALARRQERDAEDASSS